MGTWIHTENMTTKNANWFSLALFNCLFAFCVQTLLNIAWISIFFAWFCFVLRMKCIGRVCIRRMAVKIRRAHKNTFWSQSKDCAELSDGAYGLDLRCHFGNSTFKSWCDLEWVLHRLTLKYGIFFGMDAMTWIPTSPFTIWCEIEHSAKNTR